MTKTKTPKKENEYKKGLWTVEEDKILMDYVKVHGKGHWNHIAKKTSLKRCGKSCRLRWMNYLSPSVNRGNFTEEEEDLIIRLHKLLGNRWSLIAKRVPGRTDNQVKNYWNSHLCKKLGIKQQNSKATAESSLTNSVDVNPITTSSPCDNFSGITEITVDKNTKKAIEVSDMKEPVIKENYMYSFWIPENDFELNTLTMMDFFDGSCFSLV